MFSFLWGGSGKNQEPDIDDDDEYEEDPALPSQHSPPQHTHRAAPHHNPHPHSHQSSPRGSRQPSIVPSPVLNPHHGHPDPSGADQLTEDEYYAAQQQQHEQQQQYDAHYDERYDGSYQQSQQPDSSEPDGVDDPSLYDASVIPLLRASLKRKDEQLIALEEQHDVEFQQLRAKYKQLLATASASASSSPSTSAPATPSSRAASSAKGGPGAEASTVHSHPDYLSLHEQYSRLFEEYNHLQDAYAAMERGQGEVLHSMREEVEYEVRQSMHAQFEDMRRSLERERDDERLRWREEEEAWRRKLEQLQVQLTTNGLHPPHQRDDSRALHDKDAEIARLTAHIQAMTAQMENERLQMSEEQEQAVARADQQAEEIERLHAALAQQQQQQPSDIQLYSPEEWDALHAESERLRQRVAELERSGGGQGASDAEYQQHIAALEAHIEQQAAQLQDAASAAANARNNSEVAALRSQVLHLTGELAKKDGELLGLNRTVASKLDQVKRIIAKKDAEIARMQQQQKLTAAH